MKHRATVYALAAMLFASSVSLADETPPETSGGSSGNVQFLMGKTYLHDFWRPLDEPASFAIEVDFGPESSPVHVAISTHVFGQVRDVSSPFFGETGKVADGFLELSVGFVWHPVKRGVVRPYLGGGGLSMAAFAGEGWDFWASGINDHSFGYYGNAGIYFKVGDHFNIGVDGRVVRGTSITLEGRGGDADYGQVSLLMGVGWGN